MSDILTMPNPWLRRIVPDTPYEEALPVAKEIVAEAKSHSLNGYPAIGLAANQIGESVRVCCVALNGNPELPWLVLINPHIVWYEDLSMEAMEGCGSLPHVFVPVWRPDKIQVQYEGITNPGRAILQFEGWTSRVIQHEIDHLNGILITDRTEDQFSV